MRYFMVTDANTDKNDYVTELVRLIFRLNFPKMKRNAVTELGLSPTLTLPLPSMLSKY